MTNLIDSDIKNVSPLNRVLMKIEDDINEVWPSKILEYKKAIFNIYKIMN